MTKKGGSLQPRSKLAQASVILAVLAGCGGAGNPLDNPPLVSNPPPGTSGQRLSFAYFQKCINPIFTTPLIVNGATNTCAGSGCHDNANGTGGAFRVVPTAQAVDVTSPPDVIRASDMYKNFYSAQGAVLIGSTTQSRLLAKPLLLNVLHGGGLIFANAQDPNAKQIAYWIGKPVADEFGAEANSLFTSTGDCVPQSLPASRSGFDW
jgi:hypothetical protein